MNILSNCVTNTTKYVKLDIDSIIKIMLYIFK